MGATIVTRKEAADIVSESRVEVAFASIGGGGILVSPSVITYGHWSRGLEQATLSVWRTPGRLRPS
jgi:hypothetical protein